jgi:glycosyltransferase involved in cell wall biosynthesis
MIYELFPEYFLESALRENKLKHIKRANHIIAISENTKRDLINIYGIDEEKISVIYHGWNKGNSHVHTKINVLNLPEKFLLFVGTREKYKNFYFFLFSLKKVFMRCPNLKLIVTGKMFSHAEQAFIKEMQLENHIIHQKASDDDLQNLYSQAIAFVYPSIYEGFGMPILEAFANNCPVLLSNTSCFFEIAEEAALYFNPKNISDISDKIISVVNNDSLRSDLIIKGQKRLTKFGWDKAIEQTFQVYSRVIPY